MDGKPVTLGSTSGGAFTEEARATATAISLPWLAGCYFAFRPILTVIAVRVLQQDPQVGTVLNLGINFLLLGIAAFQLLGVVPRTKASALASPMGFWVLVFLGFSGCSLAWSVAVSLPAAAAYWGALAADVAIVVLLLRSGPATEIATALIKGYVFGACCFALAGWVLPAQSDLRLGDEELLGPNAFGATSAFAIFLGQYVSRLQRSRGAWNAALVFLAITLLRTLSKTTILAFLAAEAFLLIRDKSIGRRTKTIFLLATVAVVAAAWGLIASYFTLYADSGNQIETLTGRLGLWAVMLEEGLKQPWIGHGFHSVWKVIPPMGPDAFEPRHAHDELIQQFYAYGAAGVVMMIALYWTFYRQVRKLAASPRKTLLFGLIVFALVRGLADTESFDFSLPLWAMILFSAVISECCGQPGGATAIRAAELGIPDPEGSHRG
jgi:O-antigen ligase